MLVINSIGLIAVFAIVVYIICFLCRYRVIPQSLSVTAEWSGRYYWWQTTICTVMGFLGYWLATVYPMNNVLVSIMTNVRSFISGNPFVITEHGYGLLPMLGCAGVCGLALAGYYSYSPAEETKRLLTIHKVGSFTGAVLLVLFYIIKSLMWSDEFVDWKFCLIVLAISLILGLVIKGKRLVGQYEVNDLLETKIMLDANSNYKRYAEDHSIVFWMELGIIVIVSTDIINKFINIL